MLSDTLSEAHNEIEYYQRQYADIYGPVEKAVGKVKLLLQTMQHALDLNLSHSDYFGAIIRAVESLDTAAIEAAVEAGKTEGEKDVKIGKEAS